MRLAPDGEILVRGDNVTRGYYGDERASAEAFEDGWLHTGDIGELDAQGQLFVRGRKKEMIVTPEGLNVFPEDVERVLDELPGVRESAVVGLARGGEERVHAVIVLEPGADVDEVVRAANARLADHQRIRGVLGLAGRRAAADRGNAEAETAREIRRWAETGQAPGSRGSGVSRIPWLTASRPSSPASPAAGRWRPARRSRNSVSVLSTGWS